MDSISVTDTHTRIHIHKYTPVINQSINCLFRLTTPWDFLKTKGYLAEPPQITEQSYGYQKTSSQDPSAHHDHGKNQRNCARRRPRPDRASRHSHPAPECCTTKDTNLHGPTAVQHRRPCEEWHQMQAVQNILVS